MAQVNGIRLPLTDSSSRVSIEQAMGLISPLLVKTASSPYFR